VALGAKTYSGFYQWVKALGISLEDLDAEAEAGGWAHKSHGGAAFHKDPSARVAKARETMERTGVKPGRKPKATPNEEPTVSN